MWKNEGFTLVELLVVMGVLATLIAGLIILINPRDRQNQANDTAVKQSLKQVANAVHTYSTAFGAFPAAGSYAVLTTSGGTNSVVPTELTAAPIMPNANYAPAYDSNGSNYRLVVRMYSNRSWSEGGCTAAQYPWFLWTTVNSKACVVCTGGAATPPVAATTCP